MKNQKIALKELLYVEKQFQNAVNLQLDYTRREKLSRYIPTKASASILKQYLKSVTADDTQKASILIGPYGKGKSHLLLVLIGLLSRQTPGDKEVLVELREKIRRTDEEAGRLIDEIWNNGQCFLPVIVTNTSYDLNQAFLVALREALRQSGLEEIELPSNYEAAVQTAETWKREYPGTYQAFEEAVKAEGNTIEDFMQALASGNRLAYRTFVNQYPKLTSGGIFNPLIASEVHQIYMQANDVLCEQYGYSGMLILFDEFSKFMEGHPEDTIASDMKILQDMCELASSSKEKQIHITLVAHKSMKEYGRQLSKKVQNAYRGVEGRLTERLFVTSSQNNYELIQHAIGKYPAYERYVQEQREAFDRIERVSMQVAGLHSLFPEKLFRSILVEGCYPLLPVTTVLLLKISEQAAQNERTLFTFIAREEAYSLGEFIAGKRAGETVAPDLLYDYFSPMLKQNKSLEQTHHLWLAAEYALSRTEEEKERRLLKSMALLLMIGQPEDFPANRLSFEAALCLSEQEIQSILTSLTDQGIIRMQHRTGTYVFCNNVGGINIEEEIRKKEEQEAGRLSFCSFLNEQARMRYLLPKSYNQRNCITRYYRYVFMEEAAVQKLPSAASLFETYTADGILLCVVSHQPVDTTSLLPQLNRWQDGRVVLLCPKKGFSADGLLLRLKALLSLQEDKQFIESNQVLLTELKLLEEDCRYELHKCVEELYTPEAGETQVLWGSGIRQNALDRIHFQRALSENMEEYYTYLPRINHELINRRLISAPIRKARQKIMELLLSHGDCSSLETGTSPESTIYRAVLVRPGVVSGCMDEVGRKVFEEIGEFFNSCIGQRRLFAVIFSVLQEPPYGIRAGVIPIYLAYGLSQLESMPCIYQKDREVPVNGTTMQLMSEHIEEYSLYIEEASMRKAEYLNHLQALFAQDAEAGKERLSAIAEGLQSWYQSLPQYTRTYQPGKEGEKKKLNALRRLLRAGEINPRELLFEQLPKVFGCTDPGEEAAKQILLEKRRLDAFLPGIKAQAVRETRKRLGAGDEEDFLQVLQMWCMEHNRQISAHVLSKEAGAFARCVSGLHTHEEAVIINLLSKALLDLYIENWKDGSMEAYIACLDQIIKELSASEGEHQAGEPRILLSDGQGGVVEKQYKKEEDSTMDFLKNALEDAMDEFGDALTTNQKVNVLAEMLKKYLS